MLTYLLIDGESTLIIATAKIAFSAQGQPTNSSLPRRAESCSSDLPMDVAERLFFVKFDDFVASTARRRMINKSNYIV